MWVEAGSERPHGAAEHPCRQTTPAPPTLPSPQKNVPLASDKLSIFYRQLAQQLSAGLTLAQALRAPSPAPVGDRFRLALLIERGASVDQMLGAAGPWLPEADRPFLVAAAESGRLPVVLANLADRHAQMAQTRRRMIMASLYPLGVFHFGAVLFPFLRLIDFEHGLRWSLPGYLLGVAALLLPVWGAGALLWLGVRRRHPLASVLLNSLPAIGGFRKHQALANFSFALGNLLEAGAPIGRAWLSAGEIARSPRLTEAARSIHERILQGEAPGAWLKRTHAFPADYVTRYQSGEATGSLETTLLALAAHHQETANQRLAAATMIYPGLLFAAVAGLIGWFVISFFMQYYATINSLLEGM